MTEVAEGGDVFDGPRSEMLQMEDAEFVRAGPKALLFLQLLIALLTRSVVNVCAISKDFLFVSLVTNRVSLEEVCLPIFYVLNCWLNLAAICLDEEKELPLTVNHTDGRQAEHTKGQDV